MMGWCWDETCRVGLYQRGDGWGMINRTKLTQLVSERMEEGPHIPAKLLPKQIKKISGQKGRKTYPCDPKICQQEHIRILGGMEDCGWGEECWMITSLFLKQLFPKLRNAEFDLRLMQLRRNGSKRRNHLLRWPICGRKFRNSCLWVNLLSMKYIYCAFLLTTLTSSSYTPTRYSFILTHPIKIHNNYGLVCGGSFYLFRTLQRKILTSRLSAKPQNWLHWVWTQLP